MGVNEKVSDFVHQGIKLIFSNLKWIMATFGYVLLNKIVKRVHSSTVKTFSDLKTTLR